jgi:hypothetical protein
MSTRACCVMGSCARVSSRCAARSIGSSATPRGCRSACTRVGCRRLRVRARRRCGCSTRPGSGCATHVSRSRRGRRVSRCRVRLETPHHRHRPGRQPARRRRHHLPALTPQGRPPPRPGPVPISGPHPHPRRSRPRHRVSRRQLHPRQPRVPLCDCHQHILHEPGWHATFDGTTLTVTNPDGRHIGST